MHIITSTRRFSIHPTPQRQQRLQVALALLLFVLFGTYLTVRNPNSAFSVIALAPIVLVASLYQIPGGIAGALLGSLLLTANLLTTEDWPWPDATALSLLPFWIVYLSIGLFIGWVSHREEQRAFLVRSAMAETDGQRLQFLAVFESTADAVVITSPGGFLQLANRAAIKALGLSTPVVIGQDIASMVPDMKLADLFYQASIGERPVNGEVQGADNRTFSANVSPVPGVGTVAVLQDITYLKDLDKRKSEIISDVSHDLRNPLAAIQGYADIIYKFGNLNERQKTYVTRIKSSTRLMTELINDLLDVAWIEAGMEMRRERVDMVAVAKNVATAIKSEASKKNQRLTTNLETENAIVLGDNLRLRQMLSNLVSNAIKYTKDGGEIEITVARNDKLIVCSVQDNGIGISEEDMELIFNRYYRAEEIASKIKGSGLGLAIVKAIVDKHSGKIHIESEKGTGSKFIVELQSQSG